MQKFFRLPEITVQILVRPTIGHLLYIFVQWKFVWEKIKTSVTSAYIACATGKWYHLKELTESFLLKHRWTFAKITASTLWKKFWMSGIAITLSLYNLSLHQTVCDGLASHTLRRERKDLVTLQSSSCPHGRNLMWPIRSALFVDHIRFRTVVYLADVLPNRYVR